MRNLKILLRCWKKVKKKGISASCFFSREHLVATAVAAYLCVCFVGRDDSNSGNKVLEASHGKWMHMHWNMRCSGKPSVEVTIFGTMRHKVDFSHSSASHSPHTLTNCLLLRTSQWEYCCFYPLKSHPVFSDLYSSTHLHEVAPKGTSLPKQSIDLPKNSKFGPSKYVCKCVVTVKKEIWALVFWHM